MVTERVNEENKEQPKRPKFHINLTLLKNKKNKK
jgi:hypothetical protein